MSADLGRGSGYDRPAAAAKGARRAQPANMVGPRSIGVALCIAAVFMMRVAVEMPSPVAVADLISCIAGAIILGWIGTTLVARSMKAR